MRQEDSTVMVIFNNAYKRRDNQELTIFRDGCAVTTFQSVRYFVSTSQFCFMTYY